MDGASGDLEGIDRDKVKEVATVNLKGVELFGVGSQFF